MIVVFIVHIYIKMDNKIYQKMVFIMNALDKGWKVKKENDKYIFTKKHENRKEVLDEDFLIEFLETNIDTMETVFIKKI